MAAFDKTFTARLDSDPVSGNAPKVSFNDDTRVFTITGKSQVSMNDAKQQVIDLLNNLLAQATNSA